MKTIFLTGGTGYIGLGLTQQLLRRGHRVILFVRPGSEWKLDIEQLERVGEVMDVEKIRSCI